MADGNPRQNRGGTPKPARSTGGKPVARKSSARKPAGGTGRGSSSGGDGGRSEPGRNASGGDGSRSRAAGGSKSSSTGKSGGRPSGDQRGTDRGRTGSGSSGRSDKAPSGDARRSGGTGSGSSGRSDKAPSGDARRSGGASSAGRAGGRTPDSRGTGGAGRSSGDSRRSDSRDSGSRSPEGRSGGRTGDPRRSSGSEKGPYQKSGHTSAPRQREQLRVSGSGGGDLPKWIRDEVIRTTPKDRRDALLALIGDAADAFANARYTVARERLLRAKSISTRSETVRELLGLSLYRLGNWEEALRELRAYRRIAGDTTHLAVEMDCLRALGRPNDVPKVWAMLRELGASKAAEVELRVVYGSFLLDQGQPREAWKVTDPGRIHPDAHENDLRQWYVAARAAVALGDMKTADQLRRAIEDRDIGFPGLIELVNEINELS